VNSFRAHNRGDSTFSLLKIIWNHLNKKRRIQLALALVMMLASGAAELLSLASVFPFLAVLDDPNKIMQNSMIRMISTKLNFSTSSDLVLIVTLIFVLSTIVATCIRLINLWCNGRLAASIGTDLSCESYFRTLYQPYSRHQDRNSSVAIGNITTEISLTIVSLNMALQLLSSAFVAVGLLAALIFIEPYLALSTAFLLSAAYSLLVFLIGSKLRFNSELISQATKYQLRALQEGLGAIREVILHNSQSYYLELYRATDGPQRLLRAKNSFYGAFPRYSVEALGIIGIALAGIMLTKIQGDNTSIIPSLGLLALGAQRLLPALQQIYSSWSVIKGHHASINSVINMLDQPLPKYMYETDIPPLPLIKSVIFENVSFSYDPESNLVLNQISFEILAGERVGIVGTTGSGKSTILDLLLALHKPTSGKILIDGDNIHQQDHPEKIQAWRNAVGYVPQQIFLSDTSIAENIAFGVCRSKINFQKVREAASVAKISSFIESNKNGYDSIVGERGIRLSGGQRQRIGIARAIYRGAKILVLDEATSSLDNNTESAVMDEIYSLDKDITIICVAHRLRTVENCDKIIQLEAGQVLDISVRA
jgi:ABC-type multidrug transport system fused ATPase/permease subunit